MKLSQLLAVVAVADNGNFSEAALELNLSQPAVSHAIATLEDSLGVQLFLRGRHGAVATPAGEKIVHHARLALEHLEMMRKEANLHKSLHGGGVRIASFRSVATHILPEVMADFRSCYPEIAVSIVERPSYVEIEQTLRDGQADIGFTYSPTPSEFEAWEFLRDEYVVLFPPQTKISSNQMTWENIAQYPLILLPCLPCAQPLHTHVKAHAPYISAHSSIQEDSTIVSLVCKGLAVGMLPYLAAKPIPQEVQVFRLPNPLERVIAVATLVDALHSPAVFAFLETLKKYAAVNTKQGNSLNEYNLMQMV
ncbi:LysR family transcriptional regulator [Tolypothrix bouteillei VB521301]|uniref:Transcriptional regulator n=3 Tax=Nostocales TaxID=1161 RepID=A0A0C1RJG0_9CYAN|nr:LysR family transcriptional regulator [Tolypothrix bouteillei VB521301]